MRHPFQNKVAVGEEMVVGSCGEKAPSPHDQEEENASLVRLETLPDGSSPLDPKVQQSEEEDKLYAISRYHEELLQHAGGHGSFQRLTLLTCGLALASDAIELFAIPYILPSAEQELCLDETQKGWLAMASLVGMMAGGLIWGPLGDGLGRRRALLCALSVNAIFGVVAAFMPTFHLFLSTRLCSGIGIGGSLPVVFTYFSEILVRKGRGRNLSFLLSFWAIGGIFVTLLAWLLLPSSAALWGSKGLHFGKWRLFLLASALPATMAAISVAFLPESPRFLLENGRNNEALHVYRQIFAANSKKSGPDYQLTAMELPCPCPTRAVVDPSSNEFFKKSRRAVNTFLEAYAQMLTSTNTRLTILLFITWAAISFGFHGMSAWFPGYFEGLRRAQFESEAIVESNTVYREATYNTSLRNYHFNHAVFVNVHFIDIQMSHSTFHNCSFWNCTFNDVRSSRTFFRTCDFEDSTFVDTDMYKYKFQCCTFNNSTYFYSTKGGCNLDFDINVNLLNLLFENIFAQLAMLVGALTSAFLLDFFGRVRVMASSLLLSGVSICFMWLLQQENIVIGIELLFNFLTSCGWNSLDVLTTESYPANIRATSYGFLCSASRMAAILGNVVLCNGLSPVLVSVVFFAGAICAFQLLETKDYLL